MDWLNALLGERSKSITLVESDKEIATQIEKPVGVKKLFTLNEITIQYYEEKPGLYQIWDDIKLLGWIERIIEQPTAGKGKDSYGGKLKDIEVPKYLLINENDSEDIQFDSLNKALTYIVMNKDSFNLS